MSMPDPEEATNHRDTDLEGLLASLAGSFSGRVGIYARDLLTGRCVELHPDEPFETASTIKVLILVTAFAEARRGTLSLDERLTLKQGHHVRGSGVLSDLTPGLELSVSDNVATNMMIERLGVDQIEACGRTLGLSETHLFGPLHFDREPVRGVGVTTPRELANLFERIARHEAVGEPEDAKMLDILDRNQYGSALTRELPYEPLEEPGPGTPAAIQIASKSGSWDGVRNIVGYVRGKETRYVVCLLTKGCTDPRFHVDNEAMLLLPKLSRAIFDRFSGLGAERASHMAEEQREGDA
jgi:beta-lactamase class A